MTRYSILPGEQPEELFDGDYVSGTRAVEMIGAGQDVEPGFVLDNQLLEEFPIEPVKVVDRVEDAVARPDAQEQRHFAEARFQIDDHRRLLAQARQLDAAVHRDGRRARAALGAKEDERRGGRPRPLNGFSTRRRPADRAMERLLRGRPDEKLVGTGAHRLQDQIGIRAQGDGEDAGSRRLGPQPLDGRHRQRWILADIDDDHVRRYAFAACTVLDDADGHRARTHQPSHLLAEYVVLADDEPYELRHVLGLFNAQRLSTCATALNGSRLGTRCRAWES